MQGHKYPESQLTFFFSSESHQAWTRIRHTLAGVNDMAEICTICFGPLAQEALDAQQERARQGPSESPLCGG